MSLRFPYCAYKLTSSTSWSCLHGKALPSAGAKQQETPREKIVLKEARHHQRNHLVDTNLIDQRLMLDRGIVIVLGNSDLTFRAKVSSYWKKRKKEAKIGGHDRIFYSLRSQLTVH